MSAMKNVYNLITEAFSRIRKEEKDYTITVRCSNTMAAYISIVITTKDLTSNGIANLHLVLDSRGRLTYLNGNNSLFSVSNWNTMYDVFNYELCDIFHIPMPVDDEDD